MPTASSTAPPRRAASRARPSSPSSSWRRWKQGRTPDSVRNDAPIKIGKWTPENYNGKYFGKVTLATALAKSLNSVAAQLAMEVGPDAVVEAAHRMGIESDLTGQHLDRARHLRSDAAGADRGLCALRQWRLPAGSAFHPPRHHEPAARCSTRTPAAAPRASSGPRSSA